ncbi:FAS1-like dehydratase domain-containing protein [Mycobacterium camsae]|uniref:FAS1-like dehydratase domain-containing protein n=1 Tax=Mycobacterium gordonae TaxID=1778 RepID=UPI00197F3402|nr:MaoC family dehydratase N-terminal domain-containing protein [Mycobacterium gordonae]
MTSSESAEAARWAEQVNAYVAELNAIAGRRGPAPLFTEGPFAYPFVRSQITQDLFDVCARAVGDTNPLWNDPAYGAASPWGSTIGQPLLEACLSERSSQPEPPPIPGWNVLLGGTQRTYHQPFRPGDVIRGEDVWLGLEEKTRPGKPYRLFIQNTERRYINQHDRVVVTLSGQAAITASPPTASGVAAGPDFSNRKRRRYTPDELASVRADYERELSGEARRGATPRFWEDVEVGQSVVGGAKGPYDISDAVSFAGAIAICAGFAAKWREVAANTADALADPETGAPHHVIDWHFDDRFAQLRGVPYAPAFGTHMEMMLVHAVTNWMSDHGFVTYVDIQLRSMLMMGEISYTAGKVVDKRRDGERYLVELDMTSRTLDGVPYAKGKVIVDLPSRDGYSPAKSGV